MLIATPTGSIIAVGTTTFRALVGYAGLVRAAVIPDGTIRAGPPAAAEAISNSFASNVSEGGAAARLILWASARLARVKAASVFRRHFDHRRRVYRQARRGFVGAQHAEAVAVVSHLFLEIASRNQTELHSIVANAFATVNVHQSAVARNVIFAVASLVAKFTFVIATLVCHRVTNQTFTGAAFAVLLAVAVHIVAIIAQ